VYNFASLFFVFVWVNPCSQTVGNTIGCRVMQKLICVVACIVHSCRTEQVLNQKQAKKPEATWHTWFLFDSQVVPAVVPNDAQ